MAEISTHISGTASINAGEVNVIGQNSTWASSGVQAGDLFWAAGLSVRIASVQDNTHLTLAFPWPGASRATASYEVKFTPDIVRTSATQRALLDKIAGNLFSFGELNSAADMMPFFSAEGVMALTSLKAAARQFLAENFQPVQQGGGAGHLANKIRMGWTAANRVNLQVDAANQGTLWTDGAVAAILGNPGSLKFPNGWTLQWGYVNPTVAEASITFGLAFTSLAVVLVSPTGGASDTKAVSQWVSTANTTGFTMSSRVLNNGGVITAGGFPAYWFAIGKI